ncbi:MAG: 2-oxoacid:ferredoxin oxidoreductase subunit beta [Arenicellales bacterium]|jgi:2-oxoglutarate ferredoxin oxidoreductase subunit beta|nr:2-oxoacid:ferredoxin oxidoreductase subunit beta [Arenicellales bacterium]|tara:strand:- start:2032 stop:3060 length:1029 start_codon:yes stop_codon:yes gene_type:complete
MTATQAVQKPELTRKDFVSDAEVRWCPGCGDFSILAQVQKCMPKIGVPRENIVFISGIGCSSRFPYYMDTYGFHSIHGRAMTLASGLKASRPELSVWVITGDGDGLSIGGNHFLHTLRRNMDINIIMFNNRIYGLTKGQYSPTSEQGKRTKSSPMGSISYPINPVRAAIASEATWVGRSVDIDTKHLSSMIMAMASHSGASFLEVYQDCKIFNAGAFSHLTDKTVRDDRLLYLEPDQPMLFGKEKQYAIDIKTHRPMILDMERSRMDSKDLMKYDASDPTLAYMISNLDYPKFPVPVGVFVDIERASYSDLLEGITNEAKEKAEGPDDLRTLLSGNNTWSIE